MIYKKCQKREMMVYPKSETYHTIDSYDLTENDTTVLSAQFSRHGQGQDAPDQVFSTNARCPDTTAENGCTSDEDAPVEHQ
jgi:hypothetical protein